MATPPDAEMLKAITDFLSAPVTIASVAALKDIGKLFSHKYPKAAKATARYILPHLPMVVGAMFFYLTNTVPGQEEARIKDGAIWGLAASGMYRGWLVSVKGK